MKKRMLSAVIIGVFAITTISTTVQVSAAPSDQQVQEQRNKYEELKTKVNEENAKVEVFDSQISQLAIKIDDNNKQINNINKEVENTNKEIDQVKSDISSKEEVLGKRLREMYKSGGETDYISLIFSANSLSDLVSKVKAAVKLINTDQEIVKELTNSKSQLDEKVNSLEVKSQEIGKINNDIQAQKVQLDQKKAEQQQFVDKAKAEENAFYQQYLIPIEREMVQGFVNVANNENSSIDELNSAINALRGIKKQLKSSEVENEVNNAIENAKKFVSKKQAAQAAQASQSANRGGGQGDGQSVVSGDVAAKRQAIVNYAYKFLNCPYVWGATGPDTFDCSGLTSYVYKKVLGIDIGRVTTDQLTQGRAVSENDLQPGDLVFPHSGHVQIYIGNGQVIHAPKSGDVVRISPMRPFWKARRIIG